jgi:hypothetical protein
MRDALRRNAFGVPAVSFTTRVFQVTGPTMPGRDDQLHPRRVPSTATIRSILG